MTFYALKRIGDDNEILWYAGEQTWAKEFSKYCLFTEKEQLIYFPAEQVLYPFSKNIRLKLSEAFDPQEFIL